MIGGTELQELIESVRLSANLVMAKHYKATALAKRLSTPISGQKVNKLLQGLGYQVKNDSKWQVTDKGAQYVMHKPYFRELQNRVWIIEYEILWNTRVTWQLENLLKGKERKVA